MAFFIALAAASALLNPGTEPAQRPLDDLIGFSDAYRCQTNDDLSALLVGLIVWEEAGDTYRGVLASPSVLERFRAQLGSPSLAVAGSEYSATLPLKGTWQGLPLKSLIRVAWVESEAGFYLVFDATARQVLDAANRAGFAIPESGFDYRDGEALGVEIGIVQLAAGTALYCVEG